MADFNSSIKLCGDITCSFEVTCDVNKFGKRYAFKGLRTGSHLAIANSWSTAIDWAEIFNAFCRNCLQKDKSYEVGYATFFFILNGEPELKMTVSNPYSDKIATYSFSKHDCLCIYSKLNKIAGKCDLNIVDEG
jgi:hypothetical protein